MASTTTLSSGHDAVHKQPGSLTLLWIELCMLYAVYVGYASHVYSNSLHCDPLVCLHFKKTKYMVHGIPGMYTVVSYDTACIYEVETPVITWV